MAIAFPNPSRWYDEKNGCVRFVGHNGMFVVPFAVQSSALVEPTTAAQTEPELLAAFDSVRTRILDAARAVFCEGKRKPYMLTKADL